MITRDSNNGEFGIYDISHDSVVSFSLIGTAGLDWQTVGIAPYQSAAAAVGSSANTNDAPATSGNLQAMVDGQGGAVTPTSLWSPADPGLATEFGAPWLQGVMDPLSGFSSLPAPAGSAGSFDPTDHGNPASMVTDTLLQHSA